jgi:hypothetical protein
MDVGVVEGMKKGLFGLSIEPVPPSPVALGHLKQSIVAVPLGHPALNP